MHPLQETNSLIDTTCPVGDTDPTKRFKVKGSANNSAKYDRCDKPACPAQQEYCDQPTCSAQSTPIHQTAKPRLPSWKILTNEKSTVTGIEGINKTNISSPLNSRSPRPPLVSDIVSKNQQQSSRSGTPRDTSGRSEPKDYKRIVPGLQLKDTSPSATGPDSERSNTKDSTRRLLKLKKTEFIKRTVDSKQTTKHKQQIYQHESMTEDDYKGSAKTHDRGPDDSARLSAKSGPDSSPHSSGKSRQDGSSRQSTKSRLDGSVRLSAKSQPDDNLRLNVKSDRYKKSILSSFDSKRSSAGSSTKSFARGRPSRKSPLLTKSSKVRVKKNKSKRKKESRSSSPEVDDDEPYIRVDISPRKKTIDGNDISSSPLNNTLSCLNPECPKKSPHTLPSPNEDVMRVAQGSPRLSPCPCLRSFSPGSEQTSPRHSRDSPRVTLAVKPRSKLPCYNPECPKKSPRRSSRTDEDVDLNTENPFSKLTCYNADCPKKSPRKSPRADDNVGPNNEIPRTNLPCYSLECPKKSPRRPSRVDEDVGTRNENYLSKIRCYNPDYSKKNPRKSLSVDEKVCPSYEADRCKASCLTRGPVIPVYDRPPCMGYMVPPGVKDTLKDIVNKITIFGLSSGTPEVGRYLMKRLLAIEVHAERVFYVNVFNLSTLILHAVFGSNITLI